MSDSLITNGAFFMTGKASASEKHSIDGFLLVVSSCDTNQQALTQIMGIKMVRDTS